MADKDDDARRFFDPKVIARISRLDLRAQKVVEGFIAGMHRSPVLRALRRVRPASRLRAAATTSATSTGRSGPRPTGSTSSSSRPRPTCGHRWSCDVSESMHYGAEKHRRAGTLNKYEYACTAAACLALSGRPAAGLGRHDRVRRGRARRCCRREEARSCTWTPSCKRSMPRKPRQKTDPTRSCGAWPRATHGRGMIIIVLRPARAIASPSSRAWKCSGPARHDMMVFHIMDDDELTFPFAGTTRFEGMEELPDLLCDPKSLREGYIEALEEYLIEVRRGCSRMGIDYSLVQTERLPRRGAVEVPAPADGHAVGRQPR